MMRRIFGLEKEDVTRGWRKTHNYELIESTATKLPSHHLVDLGI
jgi:hypothetical protein